VPTVVRTWAPRGRTPHLAHRSAWPKLSAIAAISVSPQRRRLSHYLLLWHGTVDAEGVIHFLRHLLRQRREPMIVVWDNLPGHRSASVRGFAARHRRLHLEALASYAPELNPVEGLWAHFKAQTLANACPPDVDELIERVGEANANVGANRLDGFIRRTGLTL
jgi:transposase